MQRAAAWQRLRPQLGNDPNYILANLEKVYAAAVARGDTAELEALRREAPAQLAMSGNEMPHAIAKALDETVGPPIAAHARAIEERAKVGTYRVTMGLGLLLEQYEHDGSLPPVVPGYGPADEFNDGLAAAETQS